VSVRSPRIGSFPARKLSELDASQYDSALVSLGYEKRARQIAEQLVDVPDRTAIPFTDRHELEYETNLSWLRENEWKMPAVAENQIVTFMSTWLGERALARGREDRVRLAIDISSMSRVRIAAVVQALLSLPEGAGTDVDLLYTPAKFPSALQGDDPQVFDVGPVSRYFAGWWTNLSAPLVAVIGVGYEREMAASAIDKLEPTDMIVFASTTAGVDRYAPEVTSANQALLAPGEEGPLVVRYDLADPSGCFSTLEATLARLERDCRVVIVPLGPKMFAACAMLASALHPRSSQVIRVSAGEREKGLHRESDGKVYGLRVVVVPERGGPRAAGDWT
jgi:hypothetical protein